MAHYCLFCQVKLVLTEFPTSLREKVCETCLAALKPEGRPVQPAA